ncbi:hypothetical protein NYG90_03240 [Helicobacter sp. XJK30-2]|uniref:Uncharacterized protein n=1 Tax=Helicobacter zhangjianzhongii TaxID=2974574 RepID=A0ACC6FR03_9HELI|nr:hypothetical protein [Helicobacter sp. XJK30-2]MDL0081699.1 hypothetical protein [Helicobacter sp. XJK30-2]
MSNRVILASFFLRVWRLVLLLVFLKKLRFARFPRIHFLLMDCHATASAVSRNDRKGVLDSITLLDSRFLMRNRGFQGAGAGIYLSGNEQARAVESTIYRKKLEFRQNLAWAKICYSHYHLSACWLLIKL